MTAADTLQPYNFSKLDLRIAARNANSCFFSLDSRADGYGESVFAQDPGQVCLPAVIRALTRIITCRQSLYLVDRAFRFVLSDTRGCVLLGTFSTSV